MTDSNSMQLIKCNPGQECNLKCERRTSDTLEGIEVMDLSIGLSSVRKWCAFIENKKERKLYANLEK